MTLDFTVVTRQASFRAASEDRLVVLHQNGNVVVALADGAGGMGGGGLAADFALSRFEHAVRCQQVAPNDHRAWARLLSSIDVEIESHPQAGETTMVVISVGHDRRLVGASCGDSGAYIVGDETVEELTGRQHRRRRLGSSTESRGS